MDCIEDTLLQDSPETSRRLSPEKASVAISPDDGFRVNVLRQGQTRVPEVFFQCLSDGEVVYSAHIWRGKDFSDVSLGTQARIAEVWSAIARYLNAGGSLPELLDQLRSVLNEDFPESIYPAGMTLLDTAMGDSGAYHVFRDEETGKILVLVEDRWCRVFDTEEEALKAIYGDPGTGA